MSKIFRGYKTLGSVSNHIPLCVRYIIKREENLIITAVGKVFNTYGCYKLRLASISNVHPSDITCLTVNRDYVFTGCENIIRAWQRGVELIHTYEDDSDIKLLLSIEPFLLSINEKNNLKLWDIASKEICLELTFDINNFEITALTHPSTYMNKILLGSKQGKMQLWNIKTSQLIYSFKGWDSEITVLEQAPVVDVIAIGLNSRQIVIHNIKFDETLMKFTQEWGPVTTISFRTDGEPLMATGSDNGNIAIWDLEKKKLSSQIRRAHSSSVTGLKFLQNEPLLLTSSPDNSLKMWIFDKSGDSARVLKSRQGHSSPPTFIRFYGEEKILSAGQDSTLKSFSTVVDLLNENLGTATLHQKAFKKYHHEHLKMPHIVYFDAGFAREREWDNIAACHRAYNIVSTWSTQKCKLGSHYLRHERFKLEQDLKYAAALCVTLTQCGNFAVIGYDSGHVDVFNIQSGIYQRSFGTPRAHKLAVTGVAVDITNEILVTGGIDEKLKFWQFKSKALIENFKLDDGVSRIILRRESGLLACILDNFVISVFEIKTHKLARVLNGHTARITDACFSADGYWLITSSMDCTVRTWDLPSGCLIDCFGVTSPCISLSMSPAANYLATTHLDELSICLWANKTLDKSINLPPLPEDYKIRKLELPLAGICEEENTIEEMEVDGEHENNLLDNDLATVSLLPKPRWHSLLVWDEIKKRNKPKEPPTAPKSAPFFLPTIPGLEFKLDVSQGNSEKTDGKISRVFLTDVIDISDFGKLLDQVKPEQFELVIEKLKGMGPSAIDFEIRSLTPNLAVKFIEVVKAALKSKKDFELVYSYFGLFLKIHWQLIVDNDEVFQAYQH